MSVADNVDPLCSERLHAALIQGDFTDFGRQRNNLHYKANAWVFSDLHVCSHQAGFGEPSEDELDFDADDFSLRLAFGLVRMARNMLSDVSRLSSVLAGELSLVDAWLAQPFNQLYALAAARDGSPEHPGGGL